MNSKIFCGSRYQIVRLVHSKAFLCSRVNPVIDSIIRVDHAGELGADRIYAGQMAVLGNSKMGPVIQHMWDQEKVHKETFEKLIVKYRARPTVMVPIWNVAGFMLGAGTALMGEKAAMACTVAVESVIVEHYNDQLRTLMPDPEANKELMETIQKFRDDEQEHHDAGLDHGAEQAPFYKVLTELIKFGCKTAIAISKEFLSNRPIHAMPCRSYSTRAELKVITNEKWDIYSSVCLERKPRIVKDLNAFEREYFSVLSTIETEKSYLSDHEVKKIEDRKRIEAIKLNANLKQHELEILTKTTAQEREDEWDKEFNEFVAASRTTDADRMNDVKSLKRHLASHLHLLINRKNELWMFPETQLMDGETMRSCAERALREACGDSLKATFMGNAPYGYFHYRYPKSLKLESVGQKVFFFKAVYVSGQVKLSGKSLDYQWATYPELMDLIKNRKYLRKVRQFIIDDTDYLEKIKKLPRFK